MGLIEIFVGLEEERYLNCFSCTLDCVWNWRTHATCTVTKSLRKVTESASRRVKFAADLVCLWCLFSGVNILRTSWLYSLCVLSTTVKMCPTRSWDIPTFSVMKHSVKHLSAFTISWIAVMFSFVLAVAGLPLQGAFLDRVMNSATHFFTVE